MTCVKERHSTQSIAIVSVENCKVFAVHLYALECSNSLTEFLANSVMFCPRSPYVEYKINLKQFAILHWKLFNYSFKKIKYF